MGLTFDYEKAIEENIDEIVSLAKKSGDIDLLAELAAASDDKKTDYLWSYYKDVADKDKEKAKKTSTGKGKRSNLYTTFNANYTRRLKLLSLSKKDENEDFRALYRAELVLLDYYITAAVLLHVSEK